MTCSYLSWETVEAAERGDIVIGRCGVWDGQSALGLLIVPVKAQQPVLALRVLPLREL